MTPPLVTATPLLALATARSLERLGVAQKAIQALPLAQRLEALEGATGRLTTCIRKRYPAPPTPTLKVSTLDALGMTGGAVATWSGGPASVVQDYALTFASASTCTLTTSAGAYKSGADVVLATGPVTSWTGSVTVDGYTLALAGKINPGDVYAWSTAIVQDPGIALAVCQVAANVLMNNRGADALTRELLAAGYKDAMAWAADLGAPGLGELAASLDTNHRDGGTYGPQGGGQTSPYAWLDEGGPHAH